MIKNLTNIIFKILNIIFEKELALGVSFFLSLFVTIGILSMVALILMKIYSLYKLYMEAEKAKRNRKNKANRLRLAKEETKKND